MKMLFALAIEMFENGPKDFSSPNDSHRPGPSRVQSLILARFQKKILFQYSSYLLWFD